MEEEGRTIGDQDKGQQGQQEGLMTTTEQSAADKMSETTAAAAAATTATTSVVSAVTSATAATEATAAAGTVAEAKQKLSESDDFTEDSADNTADAAREDTSQQSGLATVESEYDTASDSPSDGEEEYDDQEEESGESGESGEEEEEEEDLATDTDGSDDDVIEVLDYERQSGDGQEQEADAKKKVDDDEDRSNPQYIPKKGTFYEHDDRTLEDEEDGKEGDEEGAKNDDSLGGGGGGSGERKGVEKSMASKTMKKWQASADRWTHDRFDESEQAPKSRAELVSAYGYDIRSEDGPPRARRRRRYARGPNKYTRNWEDEDAYSKSNNVNEHTRQRKSLPRPEEFPELGPNNGSKSRSSQNMRRSSKQSRSSIDERLDERSGGGRPRPERRTSERGSRLSNSRVDHDRGMDRDRYDQQRGPERNWDRERDYDQQQMHDGPYRDNRTDGSRYSADRMANNNNSYHNKENKLNNRGSKEKDRRGSDYKVINSLQFKNQTRNKTNEGGMPIAGPGGVPGAGGQVVHSNSGGALSGSSQSNKMNNAMDRVPDRMHDQRPVQHHYPNQQLIATQPPPPLPQQAQPPIQQAQSQQIPQQHHQQQQQAYDDHYDSYGDSKMPKDAKFPYNPPANATIQSVEIGQTDIPKYPPPQQSAQRSSKDRQQVALPASNVAALNTRSQVSPRQIVSTQASQLTPQQQQQQYQLQQTQYQTPQTQVPPPQLPQQQTQPPPTAQLHHMGAVNPQQQQPQQMLPSDSSSRSSKRYSNLRQRSTLDQPNVVAVPSPLHEQQQQQLLHQQQQQQLLLQQELHNQQQQQQQKLTSQTPKTGYPQQPSLPLNLPNEYLSQPAAASKPQPTSQAPVQYQHAPAAYYNPNTPAGNDFVTGTANQPVPVQPQPAVPVVNQQAPNPLLSAPQYPQYSQPNSATHQYIQAPPPAAYIPQTTAAPQPTPQPATAAPPPQILNYVPTITPTPPTQYPAAPYTGYQNAYNAVVPQPVAPTVPINPSPSAATAALYQSSGGITYYAPQSQTQAPRPLPSQRRPTAAIPILAPPDRKAKNNRTGDPSGNGTAGSNDSEEQTSTNANAAADNIDHILDNMFVQRPPYQPPTTRKSPSPAPNEKGATADGGGSKDADKEAVDKMGESVKNLSIAEENRPAVDAAVGAGGAEKLDLTATTPSVDPTAG